MSVTLNSSYPGPGKSPANKVEGVGYNELSVNVSGEIFPLLEGGICSEGIEDLKDIRNVESDSIMTPYF
jgi:hypothetical protein